MKKFSLSMSILALAIAIGFQCFPKAHAVASPIGAPASYVAESAASTPNPLITMLPSSLTLISQKMAVTALPPLASETSYTTRSLFVVTTTYEGDTTATLQK